VNEQNPLEAELKLRRAAENVVRLISLSFAAAAFNVVAFADGDNVMYASGAVLAAISAVLLLLSKRIASLVLKP